jgi:hypothetical protein
MSRVQECVHVMKQLHETGIAPDYPPLKELSKRLSEYIKTGEPWAGKIKFEAYGRVADVVLPRRADRQLTVVLRKI